MNIDLKQDARLVAPLLLNKVLLHDSPEGVTSGRIVEVEAYRGADDPGSHAHKRKRIGAMHGPAGVLIVKRIRGHWCVNVICDAEGEPGGILIRALVPLEGIEMMHQRRKSNDLCSGPGKLGQAMGLDGSFNGLFVTDPSSPVRIVDDGTPPPLNPGNSVRIGLSPGKGEDLPWRWFV